MKYTGYCILDTEGKARAMNLETGKIELFNSVEEFEEVYKNQKESSPWSKGWTEYLYGSKTVL